MEDSWRFGEMDDYWRFVNDTGSGLVVGVPTWGERLGEREREIEGLRAELLNDPHTLLLLPAIRKRLYKMSFRDDWKFRSPILHSSVDVLRGGIEEFCRVYNEFLSFAKSHPKFARSKHVHRSVKDTTYYYLVGLDILKTKAFYDIKLRQDLARLLRSITNAENRFSFLVGDYSFNNFVPVPDCELEDSASNAMVVAALVVLLLYCVCQYRMLFVDRGRGSMSYSSGALDFRDVYVSVVLFHGAYVWIKFRQAAASNTSLKRKSCEKSGVYRRAVKDKSGAITHYRYEPRLKPPREKLDSGTSLQLNCLSLGQYESEGEAKIVRQIAASYYGKGEGVVALEDGSFLTIPAMDEEEKRLSGMDKAKWVTGIAKQVFQGLQQGTVISRRQSRTSNAHCEPSQRFRGAFPGFSAGGVVERSETRPVELASVGAEQVADGGGSSHESIRAAECPGVQHNVPELENGAEEPDDLSNISVYDDETTMSGSDIQHMIAELLFVPSNALSQHSSFLGSENLGDPSPPIFQNDASQEFVGCHNLNYIPGCETFYAARDNIVVSVKERILLVGQVNHLQQVTSRQKKLLEDSALQIVGFQHRLTEAEAKNSVLLLQNVGLQHQLTEAAAKNSVLQQENEQLKAMLQEGAGEKSQVGTWLADFSIDLQQDEGR